VDCIAGVIRKKRWKIVKTKRKEHMISSRVEMHGRLQFGLSEADFFE
jgi:hypothetical protein